MLPINDFVYIVESETESSKVQGFYMGEDGLPMAGYGTIYALPEDVTDKENEENLKRMKVGMNVWYTKYAAEEVFAKDDEGLKIDRLKSVHISSIHSLDV